MTVVIFVLDYVVEILSTCWDLEILFGDVFLTCLF